MSSGAGLLGAVEMRSRSRHAVPAVGHALNNALGVCLLGIVALSPLPLGSNRPLFWALGAAVIGLVGAWYFATLASTQGRLRVSIGRLPAIGLLFAGVCAFLLFQILPLGVVPGEWLPNAAGRPLMTLSVAPSVTGLALLQLLGYGLLFFLMLQAAANRWRAGLLLQGLFAVVVAYALLGLAMLTQFGDTLLGMEKWAYHASATASFVNRNSYATFLAFGLSTGVALMFVDSDGARVQARLFRTLAIGAGLFFIGVALFATNSRMGLAAGVVGALVVAALGGIKARWNWYRWLGLAGGVGAAAVLMLGRYGGGVVERLVTVEGSADGRGLLYEQVTEMIASRPLFGYGAGTFEWAFPLFHRPPLSVEVLWDKAHSTYLQLWAELGVVAGSVPLVILMLIGGLHVRLLHTSDGPSAPALAGLGVLVVAAIHSLVDFSLEIQANVYLFVAVLAIGAAGAFGGRSRRAEGEAVS